MNTASVADPLGLRYAFNQLNLADLLSARDAYHFHLMNKKNVVGGIHTGDRELVVPSHALCAELRIIGHAVTSLTAATLTGEVITSTAGTRGRDGSPFL